MEMNKHFREKNGLTVNKCMAKTGEFGMNEPV